MWSLWSLLLLVWLRRSTRNRVRIVHRCDIPRTIFISASFCFVFPATAYYLMVHYNQPVSNLIHLLGYGYTARLIDCVTILVVGPVLGWLSRILYHKTASFLLEREQTPVRYQKSAQIGQSHPKTTMPRISGIVGLAISKVQPTRGKSTLPTISVAELAKPVNWLQ